MIQDHQLDIYKSLMLPSLRSIVHMQLVGFPMDYPQVEKTAKELNKIQKVYLTKLYNSKLVKDYEWVLQKEAFIAKNKSLKKKFIPIEQFKDRLNPNSGIQVAGLLYNHLGFPVVNTTDTGAPATDKETLEGMYKQLLQQFDIDEKEL
jgi:DNA polymerase I-like protein with 3'-5' exonuclease and polymerase domains